MADKILPKDILSGEQIKEGERAYAQFKNFHFGVTVTTPDLASSLAKQTCKELQQVAGADLFVSEVNFSDAQSVDEFVNFWLVENPKLLKDLDKGTLLPK